MTHLVEPLDASFFAGSDSVNSNAARRGLRSSEVMRTALFSLLLLFSFSFACMAADRAKARSEPYIYCNVYLSGFCFGVSQGDVVEMRPVIDFVLYDVALEGVGKARIYSGYHPSVDQDVGQFSPCSRIRTKLKCESRPMGKEGIEALIGPSKNGTFMHLTLDQGAETEKGISFLANIRACRQTANDALVCDK